MTHPAADLLRAIADGKQMERFDNQLKTWGDCSHPMALWLLACDKFGEVRISRPMVTRTVTYPEPLRVKPEKGSDYWTVYCWQEKPLGLSWDDSFVDNRIFNAGMAFATEADAAEAHRALFGGDK